MFTGMGADTFGPQVHPCSQPKYTSDQWTAKREEVPDLDAAFLAAMAAPRPSMTAPDPILSEQGPAPARLGSQRAKSIMGRHVASPVSLQRSMDVPGMVTEAQSFVESIPMPVWLLVVGLVAYTYARRG